MSAGVPVVRSPQRRGALDRPRIVATAVRLADAGGLGAVSVRKVAAALDARPMRLYAHVATKEEVLELMLDAVYGELLEDRRGANDVPTDWRATLREEGERVAHAAVRHPWFLELARRETRSGPRALERGEAILASLDRSRAFGSVDDAFVALATVESYVLGAAHGRDRLAVALATADRDGHAGYPTLARISARAVDDGFARGLACVLEGIAVGLQSKAS